MRRRGVIAGAGGAVVALAVAAGLTSVFVQGVAAHTHIAARGAPVIQERFTTLPCAGTPARRTMLELEGCAEHQVLASDAQIDSLNNRIYARLGTARARHDFVSGHNAWMSYRHAYCLSVADANAGGTLAPLDYITCVASLDASHVRRLDSFVGALGSR